MLILNGFILFPFNLNASKLICGMLFFKLRLEFSMVKLKFYVKCVFNHHIASFLYLSVTEYAPPPSFKIARLCVFFLHFPSSHGHFSDLNAFFREYCIPEQIFSEAPLDIPIKNVILGCLRIFSRAPTCSNKYVQKT